jgi:hypothetical protein
VRGGRSGGPRRCLLELALDLGDPVAVRGHQPAREAVVDAQVISRCGSAAATDSASSRSPSSSSSSARKSPEAPRDINRIDAEFAFSEREE